MLKVGAMVLKNHDVGINQCGFYSHAKDDAIKSRGVLGT